MAKGFSMDLSGLEKGINAFMGKSEAAIRMYAETAALSLQNYMRDKAAWTDRTGAARQRLTGNVEKVTSGFKIVLAHGVNHGMWLELAHEKRFAIIQPTILVKSNEIMEGFDHLLERMNK